LEKEVIRSMRHASDPEVCDKCGKPMDRIYTVPQFNIPVPFAGYYDHGLGCEINTKRDIKEACKRLGAGRQEKRVNPITGEEKIVEIPEREIVQIGTEKLKPKPAPSVADVKIPNEIWDKVVTD
jgi:hypothetical protein